MLILQLILMASAALVLYIKPIIGLAIYLIFDTYIGMQTINLLPFSDIKTKLALYNQLIIFILLARAIMSQNRKMYFTKESKSLLHLVLIFIFWSFLSFIWVNLINEERLLHQLERLFKMMFFTLTVFMTIDNKKQLKTILFIGLAAYFTQNLFQILEFFANDRSTVQGGGLSLLVFSIIMLQKRLSPVLKLFLILCVFLVISSYFLTGTRRGIGALMIILFYTFYYNKDDIKVYRLILPLAILLLSIYLFSDVNLSRRLNQTSRIVNIKDDFAWGARNKLWEAGAMMIYERPFFGHGFGISDNQMGKYMQDTDYRATKLRMHNAYLKAWAELGIVGLLLLIAILYKIIRIYFRTALWFKNQREWMYYALFFGSCMQIFGLSIEGFFGWSAYLDKVFWFYIAFALTIHKVMLLNENNKYGVC
jgi:O-antigen ligase